MGRHYNRTKQRQGGQVAGACSGKANTVERTSERLAEAYGVHPTTIIGHGKFAAAVETLKAIDPDIEQKVVTGKGPTRTDGVRPRRDLAESCSFRRTRTPGRTRRFLEASAVASALRPARLRARGRGGRGGRAFPSLLGGRSASVRATARRPSLPPPIQPNRGKRTAQPSADLRPGAPYATARPYTRP